jgi:hypothetical protein
MTDPQPSAAPADDLRRGTALAATRAAGRAASSAMGMLLLTAGVAAVGLVLALQDLAYLSTVDGVPTPERAREMNERAGWVNNVGWLAFLFGTMALTRWYRASAAAAVAGGARAPGSRRAPAWLRPYQLLRELHDTVDPDRVVDLPALPQTGEHVGDYRAPATKPRAASPVGAAPLLAWWLLWLACTGIILLRFVVTVTWTQAKQLDAVVGAGNVVVASLAVLIVHRIGRRLAERTRRVFAEP